LAEERELDGWVLTLDIPSYLPVMKYAEDRALRRAIYEAYTTRASDQGPNAGQWDNSQIIEEILALRHEQAQLLGFSNYAEVSLELKMARSTDDVMAFLNDLARRSTPQARRELAEVQGFASEHGGPARLETWDIPYWPERLAADTLCEWRRLDGCLHEPTHEPSETTAPTAYLVCNFTPPIEGLPTLLTHDEVQALFHEFGHGLHHMLTRVDYPAVAGINGVAWDAAEIPRQSGIEDAKAA
jgi:Zn-dependent oligopeptidase